MRIFQVDSFTNKPFTGNPAGVCILPEDIPDSEMLNIAKEMNLPETAFLQGNGVGYNLRWFTPPYRDRTLRSRDSGFCPYSVGDWRPAP